MNKNPALTILQQTLEREGEIKSRTNHNGYTISDKNLNDKLCIQKSEKLILGIMKMQL